jgi:hypothetical protein
MSDKPLFQGMDEKERELAPQQVPGAARPAADEAAARDPDGEAVVGAEGRYESPVVPAQPTIGVAGTVPVPPTAAPDEVTRREQDAADRARE